MNDLELFNSVVETSRRGDSGAFPETMDGSATPARRIAPARVEQFVAIIRAGPTTAGGSDYADARYYVDRAIPASNSTGNSLVAAAIDSLPGVAQTVTATNLAELAINSHLLTAGTVVQVFALYSRSSPGAKVYVFDLEPARMAVVQITAAATGAGEYAGKILGGTSSASAGTDLAMPAGMSIPATDNALVINTEEDGVSGHRLKIGSYAVGVIRGATMDVPPRAIVIVRGGAGRTDSPTTLGGTSEGSETADTTSWSKATDGSPLDLYVVSRVVYNDAGDQALYSFVRKCSFDARGLLYAVSAEARVTVDVTEACS